MAAVVVAELAWQLGLPWWRLGDVWLQIDLRPPPALRVAGITGYDRLRAAIPVRDMRGTPWKPAVVCA